MYARVRFRKAYQLGWGNATYRHHHCLVAEMAGANEEKMGVA
jgi:hypothetical protein